MIFEPIVPHRQPKGHIRYPAGRGGKQQKITVAPALGQRGPGFARGHHIGPARHVDHIHRLCRHASGIAHAEHVTGLQRRETLAFHEPLQGAFGQPIDPPRAGIEPPFRLKKHRDPTGMPRDTVDVGLGEGNGGQIGHGMPHG